MSEDNGKNEESTTAEVESPKVKAPKEKSVACPSSPTGEHDVFHNEGTDEKYCRYCGHTE